MTGRIGSSIAILGSIVSFIAFFLPWFVVVIVIPVSIGSCTTTTIMTTVGPLNPPDGAPLNLPGWQTLFYLILVTASLLLSLIVFLRPAARKRVQAAWTHLLVSFMQFVDIVSLNSPPSGGEVTLIQVLSGFWVGLFGFITMLIGSILMLIESTRAPDQ
jgi:hypothetical protein